MEALELEPPVQLILKLCNADNVHRSQTPKGELTASSLSVANTRANYRKGPDESQALRNSNHRDVSFVWESLNVRGATSPLSTAS